jgi:hypothetical protein
MSSRHADIRTKCTKLCYCQNVILWECFMPNGDNFPSLHPYKLVCRDRSDIYALLNIDACIHDGWFYFPEVKKSLMNTFIFWNYELNSSLKGRANSCSLSSTYQQYWYTGFSISGDLQSTFYEFLLSRFRSHRRDNRLTVLTKIQSESEYC